MTKWEYMVVDAPVESEPFREASVLNEYGRGGWELVARSLKTTGALTHYRCLFKRQINDVKHG